MGDESSASFALVSVEVQDEKPFRMKLYEDNYINESSNASSASDLQSPLKKRRLLSDDTPHGCNKSFENSKTDSCEKAEKKEMLKRTQDVVLQNDGSTADDMLRHKNERDGIQNWKIDKDAWKDCTGEKLDEMKIKKLLEDKTFPDDDILLQMIKTNTSQANVVQMVIRKICDCIKMLSPKIRHVWLAYRSERREREEGNKSIVFVIHTSEIIDIKCQYTTYQRCEDEISGTSISENRKIYEAEQSNDNGTEEMAKIKAYVKSNAKKLMLKHSNLTKVSPSYVKSSKADSIQNIPCIALYVQIKGLVPYRENTFEKTITEFPIDVREGVFTLCGKPGDFHQNVKMGCQIDSGFGTSQGTIGPFVQLENQRETYFLTGAHVVLNDQQMRILTKNQSECIYYGISGNNTFQPPESETAMNARQRHRLGKVELAVYNEGDENEAGFELALVEIDRNREPLDGSFPDDTSSSLAGARSSNSLQFSTGKLLKRKSIVPKSKAYKFGCVTGLTEGQFVDDCTSLRTNKLEERGLGWDVTLYNLIHISDISLFKLFARKGDSGSLVFAVDGDETCAVGIFVGKMGRYYMATPIEDAVRVIGKTLSLYKDQSRNSDKYMETENYGNFEPIQLPFNKGDDSRNQTTDDIVTNIIHHSEHNFATVKTELTELKRHIDQTNEKLIQYLDEKFKNVQKDMSAKSDDRK